MGLPNHIKVHGIQGLLSVSQLLEVDIGKAQGAAGDPVSADRDSTGSAGLNFSYRSASVTCECRKCEETLAYHTDLGGNTGIEKSMSKLRCTAFKNSKSGIHTGIDLYLIKTASMLLGQTVVSRHSTCGELASRPCCAASRWWMPTTPRLYCGLPRCFPPSGHWSVHSLMTTEGNSLFMRGMTIRVLEAC